MIEIPFIHTSALGQPGWSCLAPHDGISGYKKAVPGSDFTLVWYILGFWWHMEKVDILLFEFLITFWCPPGGPKGPPEEPNRGLRAF